MELALKLLKWKKVFVFRLLDITIQKRGPKTNTDGGELPRTRSSIGAISFSGLSAGFLHGGYTYRCVFVYIPRWDYVSLQNFCRLCCSIFFCIFACFLYPIQLKADSGKNFHYEIGSLSIWLGKKRFCRRGGSEEGKTPRALGYYGYYFASLKICRADS